MTKFWPVSDTQQPSCFDTLSTNGKRAALSTSLSFALSPSTLLRAGLSKGDRQIDQEIVMHPDEEKHEAIPASAAVPGRPRSTAGGWEVDR
jgi:hypothetical protein